MAVALLLGTGIRRANYINAELADVKKGGLEFNRGGKAGTVMLMGDSNGSMYGKVLKEVCSERDARLTVVSVAAGDPLPGSSGDVSLWSDSMSAVQRMRPDCLILVCAWE